MYIYTILNKRIKFRLDYLRFKLISLITQTINLNHNRIINN
jgi:hypothetical protein